MVVNDLAERVLLPAPLYFISSVLFQGIHLATDFVSRLRSEEQRTALFQIVEDYRSRVKGVAKDSLRLC